jgi:hypothetical protein
MADASARRTMFWAGLHMLCRFGVWVLSPVLYIWTLYYAYLTSFVAVLISLAVPVGPQLYYAWQIWGYTRTPYNLYIILCAAWVVFAVLGIATRIAVESSKD